MTNTADNKPLVIVGTGLGGYNLAKEFRKINSETPMVIISQGEGHFYSKPQLSTALSLSKTPSQLVISDVNQMQTQLKATIFTQSCVKNVDRQKKSIQFESQDQLQDIAYQDLVLAIGAAPKPFSLLDDHQHHYRINHLEEYANFIENLPHYERLCIIGSGLVGIEFAHDLAMAGKKVDVVSLDPCPLYQLAPAPIGQALQHALEKLNVTFHTQTQLARVCNENEKFEIYLNTGKAITADAVLTAIGLNPNTQLANMAGIKTEQGIVVDNYLQTSENNVYALGDCAQINGTCLQYVAPILQSARALAQTLAGIPTQVSFPPTPISLKVSSYPVILYPPLTVGEWEFDIQQDGVKAMYYDSNAILRGYALSGKATEHRQSCSQLLNKTLQMA